MSHLNLGTWVFPEKLRDLPILVSVGKSKTDAFDNVMANMNVVQTVADVRFNLVEDKDQKKAPHVKCLRNRGRRILALNLAQASGFFFDQCTVSRSYFFTIRKCGNPECQICLPPCLPPDVFSQLHAFPDSVPGEDGHYKEFEEVYGTDTTEEYRPSLQQKVPGLAANSHGIPFAPSAQTARTVGKTVKCIACDKPRVIYSTHKLTTQDYMILKRVLDLYQYSCGCELQELMPQERGRAPKISALLDHVFVRANLHCTSPVEIPYFSAGIFPSVCFYCSDEAVEQIEGTYSTCESCRANHILPFKRKNVENAREKKKEK